MGTRCRRRQGGLFGPQQGGPRACLGMATVGWMVGGGVGSTRGRLVMVCVLMGMRRTGLLHMARYAH